MASPHRINNGPPQTVRLPGNGSVPHPKPPTSTIVTVDGKKFRVTTLDNEGNPLPIPQKAQENIKANAKKLVTDSNQVGKNEILNFDSTVINDKKYTTKQKKAFQNIQQEFNDFESALEDEDAFNVPNPKEKKTRTPLAQSTPHIPKKSVKPKKPDVVRPAVNPHKGKVYKTPEKKKAESDGNITSGTTPSSSSTESSTESSSYRESSISSEISEYSFVESTASEDTSTEHLVEKKTKKKTNKTKTKPKKKKISDLDIKTLQPNVVTKVAEYFSTPRKRTRLERISDLFSKIKNLPLRLFGCSRQKDERLPKLPPHWTLDDAVTALNKLEQSHPQQERNIERYAQAKKQLAQRFVKEALKAISTEKKKEKKENKDNAKTWFEELALPLFERCQNFEARKQLAQKYPDLVAAALNNENFSEKNAIDIMAQLSPEQQLKLLIKNRDREPKDFDQLLPAAILTLANVDEEKLQNLLEIFNNYDDADLVVNEFLDRFNQGDSNERKALYTKIKIHLINLNILQEALSDFNRELLTLQHENELPLVKETLIKIFSEDNELNKTTAALMLPVTVLEQILNESPPLAEIIQVIPYMTHSQIETVILHSNDSDLVQAAFSRLHSQKSPLSKNLQDNHLNNFNLLLANDLKKKIVAAINALPKDSDAIDKENALKRDFKQMIVDYLSENSHSENAIKNLIDETNKLLNSLDRATYNSFIEFLERTDSSSLVSKSTSDSTAVNSNSNSGSESKPESKKSRSQSHSNTETDSGSSKDKSSSASKSGSESDSESKTSGSTSASNSKSKTETDSGSSSD